MKPKIKATRVTKKIWGPDDDYLVIEPQVDECELKDGDKVVTVILPTLEGGTFMDTGYTFIKCEDCEKILGAVTKTARTEYEDVSTEVFAVCEECRKERREEEKHLKEI